MYLHFLKRYRDLETQVLAYLREKVRVSPTKSEFVNSNAIQIDIEDDVHYVELVIINDRHTLIDSDGNHYEIFNIAFEHWIHMTQG